MCCSGQSSTIVDGLDTIQLEGCHYDVNLAVLSPTIIFLRIGSGPRRSRNVFLVEGIPRSCDYMHPWHQHLERLICCIMSR